MGIPLDKLLSVEDNKFLFSKAAMGVVEKIDNIRESEETKEEKIVTVILNLLLNEKVKYNLEIEKIEKE